MISKELRNIFAQAVGYAKSSKHEYLTVEHVFLMLLHDQTIEQDKIHFDVNTQSRMQYNSNDWLDFRTKLKVLLKAVIEGES